MYFCSKIIVIGLLQNYGKRASLKPLPKDGAPVLNILPKGSLPSFTPTYDGNQAEPMIVNK